MKMILVNLYMMDFSKNYFDYEVTSFSVSYDGQTIDIRE